MSTVLVDPATAAKQDIHPQAEKIDQGIKAAQEAGDLKVSVITRMVEAWKSLAKADDTLSKGLLADAVAAIVPVLTLPEKSRPKYAKIAELILAAMGREVHAVAQFKLSDGTLESRTNMKTNAYRQYATPYVTMARWEAGLFNKAEKKHQERNPGLVIRISYGGSQYTSPVSALKAGVPPITCFRLFRNIISPQFVDLTVVHGSKSENAAKAAAAKMTVTVRDTDDDGRQIKAKAKIAGHQSLTVGTILGLLEKFPENFTQAAWNKLQAELVKHEPVNPK